MHYVSRHEFWTCRYRLDDEVANRNGRPAPSLKFMEIGFSSAGPDWACIGDNWAEIGKVDEQFIVKRKSRVPAN
ncbi:hypothetical protein AVEN_25369-1 [Araneus ventricosus]|uniref:Uncharacterized protein n=1 Tax=Araneus ventricosus TaxID=182803 RepID=A0A4Y2EF23_ARAVE|nr:hypothetical protein AVEN_25369-1 [Araneus ventricosus]